MKLIKRTQCGFSLIEILVSVLIMSVGLLGLGGLQIAGVKGSSNAHYRSTAAMLAQNLGDRMRSNRAAVKKGSYEQDLSCNTAVSACRRTGVECTTEQLAKFDLFEIKCGVSLGSSPREGGIQNLLPSGDIEVSCNNKCGVTDKRRELEIKISWSEQKLKDGETPNEALIREIKTLIIP